MKLVRLAMAGAMLALMAAQATPQAQPPAADPGPTLVALGTMQPGLWHLRRVDGGTDTPGDVCLGDPRVLLQLRHGAAACGSFVVANEAKLTTVQYSCPGAGGGRTSVRLESAGAVHIDSQGIAENAPFAFVAEARRTGTCTPGHPLPARPGPAAAPR
jgi:hypothetical protein